MWWYNTLEDNKGSISHILRLDSITAGYILLTATIFAPRRENYDPILTMKGTEWRKFIDYFGISTESDPSRVDIINVIIVHIGYIPKHSSVKIHILGQHLY